MNYDTMQRNNRCEECLQTDILASMRKSHKDVGISMKSSIITNGRQDSFPNLVTLEPNFGPKSIHISTARDFEPTHDFQRRSFYFNDPIISKNIYTKNISEINNINNSTRRHYRQKSMGVIKQKDIPIDLDEDKENVKVNESKSNSCYLSLRDEKEKTEDLTPTQYNCDLSEPRIEHVNNYHTAVAGKENIPYTNNIQDCHIECVDCGKRSFAGVKEEIRRHKEMLANSLQKVVNYDNSIVKHSNFTIKRVNRAMSSENKTCGKSQEYFRTPIRKSLKFPLAESHYGARSATYESERRECTSGSRPRDSIKDFQKKLQGMERNRANLKNKMKKLRT